MKHLALFLLLAAAIGGCSADARDQSRTKTSLGTVATATLSVELLGDGPLQTGLTPVYVRVKGADGATVTDASVTLVPVMTMSTPARTQHGAPVVGAPTIDGNGLYRFDVVFQMGSMGTATWSATVGVTPVGASAEEVAYFSPLTVVDTGRAKTFVYTNPDTLVQTHYVASLNFPIEPRIGLDPVVVTLHDQASMISFPPVDDASLALDPKTPLGQGSPGSVDPTLASSGRYEGELRFSAAGEWETTITVTRGAVVVGAPIFTTIF